ncbi:LapA family protein [Comamonadaceae bacterium OH2545_COT-014]|nr:LapA family protein [Comamonadaceae bacterium OH2545_COT-014]
MRLLQWCLKAAVFFALFAFALNNQQDATVNLLFGHRWRAPMMLIVLAAFAAGVVIGVAGMLPGWWRRRAAPAPAAPLAAGVVRSDVDDSAMAPLTGLPDDTPPPAPAPRHRPPPRGVPYPPAGPSPDGV